MAKSKVKANKAPPRTSLVGIILVVICTALTSSGQLLLKIGTQSLKLGFMDILTNLPLMAGIALYGFGAILLIIALKYGELSILYPFISLSFIWVMLLSIYVLHEHVSIWNWIGVATILLGVSFIGKGGSV